MLPWQMLGKRAELQGMIGSFFFFAAVYLPYQERMR